MSLTPNIHRPAEEDVTQDAQVTTPTPVTWPAHDPETYRHVPESSTPLDRARIDSLLAAEWERFEKTTPNSAVHHARALGVLPLGVPSSFQHWDPYPISIAAAKGAWLDRRRRTAAARPVDGLRRDAGRPPQPAVSSSTSSRRCTRPARCSSRPSPQATEMSERFPASVRARHDSGSRTRAPSRSCTRIRAARAYTERKAIVKIEGGYHGGYDALQVSVKPAVADIGPADAPIRSTCRSTSRPARFTSSPTTTCRRSTQIFGAARHRDRAVVIEPVIENLAIVVPMRATSQACGPLCDQHGVVLIFDEVKTGLTAGSAGAAQRLGVTPDLITLAKSIGGGLPLAAFGGKREVMEVVVDGRMAHFGTYNGNPLVMAAAGAVDEICTQEALDGAEAMNVRALERDRRGDHRSTSCPPTPSGLGVKGCVTWSTTPVRNYRDYKATDFGAAELSWLWGVNRDVLTPPGLDEQWLVSLAHTDDDMNILVGEFGELAGALRA